MSCLALFMLNMLMISLVANTSFCFHGVDDVHVIESFSHVDVDCDEHEHEHEHEHDHLSISCFDVTVEQILTWNSISQLQVQTSNAQVKTFLLYVIRSHVDEPVSNFRVPIDHSMSNSQVHQTLENIRLLI
jgi:hypothetical protein